jgi:hypothetical protein
MELLTDELRKTLPPLYSQEASYDPIVYVKFFTPDSSWTWFVTEGSEEHGDFRFFGFVEGQEQEWGYFVLSELEAARGPHGLEIERDLYFTPRPFSQLKSDDSQKTKRSDTKHMTEALAGWGNKSTSTRRKT